MYIYSWRLFFILYEWNRKKNEQINHNFCGELWLQSEGKLVQSVCAGGRYDWNGNSNEIKLVEIIRMTILQDFLLRNWWKERNRKRARHFDDVRVSRCAKSKSSTDVGWISVRRRCAHCIHGMICVAQAIKVGHAALSSSLFLLHVRCCRNYARTHELRMQLTRCCHFIFFALTQKANRETRICLRLVFNFLSIIQFIVVIALFGHPLLLKHASCVVAHFYPSLWLPWICP